MRFTRDPNLGAASATGDRRPAARRRVGIVGGGLAGVSLAWLLDGACDVVLFEKAPRLGGHARTVEVVYRGAAHAVDLAAQFFAPRVHPTFVALLELLGVAGATITRAVGMTLTDAGAARPRFVSPLFGEGRSWPLYAPWNLAGQAAFVLFALHAARLERSGDWSVPLDDWLRRLPGLTHAQRESIVLPWLAALAGCPIDTAREFSARAAIAIPARALPRNPFEPFRWRNMRAGLASVVERLAASCSTLTTRLGAPAVEIELAPTSHRIHADGGPAEEVDEVVLACPPHAARAVLAGAPGLAAVSDILGRFRTFGTRMVVHTDPVYMPSDKRVWSAYNATTSRGWCEASIWYGALRERLPDGSTLDVFKSWATARSREPREITCEASFVHPLICPGFIAAQQRLTSVQGRGGIWFAGSYCRDVDLQESALDSAVRVAEALAPGAANLRAFRARAGGPT